MSSVTVYLLCKPGEEVYASCRTISADRLARLKSEGWTLVETIVDLPPFMDQADMRAKNTVKRSLSPAEGTPSWEQLRREGLVK